MNCCPRPILSQDKPTYGVQSTFPSLHIAYQTPSGQQHGSTAEPLILTHRDSRPISFGLRGSTQHRRPDEAIAELKHLPSPLLAAGPLERMTDRISTSATVMRSLFWE